MILVSRNPIMVAWKLSEGGTATIMIHKEMDKHIYDLVVDNDLPVGTDLLQYQVEQNKSIKEVVNQEFED